MKGNTIKQDNPKKEAPLVLNFCWKAKLSKPIVEQYNALFYGVVSDGFPKLIDLAISQDNTDLALLNCLSRQNYTNPLMHYVTMITLCEEISKEQRCIKVVYDCPPIKDILLSLFAKHKITTQIDFEYNKPLHRSFTYGRSILLLIYKISIQVAIKLFIKHQSNHNESMLLEHHVTPGFETNDRYTKGFLDEMLSKKGIPITRAPVFSFYKPFVFFKMLLKFRKHFSTSDYIFHENTLSINDTLVSFRRSLQLRRLSLPKMMFSEVDVSPIFSYWNYHHFDISESMGIFNLHTFFRKLKNAQLAFPVIMNWCENQLISKSWNRSARLNFPSAKLIGMMGYNPEPFMNNLYPTSSEHTLKLLPDVFLCISRNARHEFRRYYPKMHSVLMPAFRFQHLFDRTVRHSDMSKHTLLFCGDIDIQNTIETMRLLFEAISTSSYKNTLSCYVKLHPTTSQEYFFNAAVSDLPPYARIIDGATEDWLKCSDIVLSSGSGICLESMCKGVPVIVLGNPYQLYKNTLHAQKPCPLWRFAATPAAVRAALDFYYCNATLVKDFYFKNKLELLEDNFASMLNDDFITLIDNAFYKPHDTLHVLQTEGAEASS